MEFNLKKSIINKVALTEKDKADYELAEAEGGGIQWNAKKDAEMPLFVDFSSDELQYLSKVCESMSDQEYPDEVWNVVERIYNALTEK